MNNLASAIDITDTIELLKIRKQELIESKLYDEVSILNDVEKHLITCQDNITESYLSYITSIIKKSTCTC